jgi:hypothetical protein
MELHPIGGGFSGYPVWSREEQFKKWNAGEETDSSHAFFYRWSDHLMAIVQYCQSFHISDSPEGCRHGLKSFPSGPTRPFTQR